MDLNNNASRITAVRSGCTGRDTCQCHPCVTRRQKQYRFEFENGLRRTTDAGRARAHIDWLASLGIGRRTIAESVDVKLKTLYLIATGQRSTIRVVTEQRILAFTPASVHSIANASTVDATATRLRYQALIALGYTQQWVCQHTGRSNGYMALGTRVTRARAHAVLALCRSVGDTPGPSSKAAIQARRRGWRVPADYDEDEFYAIDWDGTEELISSECKMLGYVAEYDWLSRDGVPLIDIAARLGITTAYLQNLLSRRNRGVTPFGEAAETEGQEIA